MKSILPLLMAASAIAFHTESASAQTPARQPRIQGTSFLLARYASTETLSLYGAYGHGSAMGLVGVVRNTRTSYQAIIVGGGTRLRVGRRDGLTLLAAIATGSDGPALRLYVLPAFRAGRWSVSGNAASYVPLAGRGRLQVLLDPLALSFRVTSALGAGIAGVARAKGGTRTVVGVGPFASVRVLRATIRAEMIRLSGSGRIETRAALGVAF